jgi:hypothetical protein
MASLVPSRRFKLAQVRGLAVDKAVGGGLIVLHLAAGTFARCSKVDQLSHFAPRR